MAIHLTLHEAHRTFKRSYEAQVNEPFTPST